MSEAERKALAEREARARAENDAVKRRNAEKWKRSPGKTAYLRYLSGRKLSPAAAIRAKCAECCGGYADGYEDCLVPLCPLYPFMPYAPQEPKAPRPKKPQTAAQKAAFEKMHAACASRSLGEGDR